MKPIPKSDFDNLNISNRYYCSRRWDYYSKILDYLSDKPNVFNELKRISNNIIISLPYKWSGRDVSHNDIDENVIYKWFNQQPTYQYIIHEWIIQIY